MSTNFRARSPKARVFIGEVEVPITSVTLYHVLNTLPYAEVEVLLDNPGIHGATSVGGVEINVKNIGQLSRVLQEKFYNSFDILPDTTIICDDDNVEGAPNPITFHGFLANPGVMVRSGQFVLAFTVLHSMVRLQAFNPMLYSAMGYYGTNDDYIAKQFGTSGTAHASSDPHMKRDNSIADRVYVAINCLVRDYTNAWTGTNNPPTIAMDSVGLLNYGSNSLSAFAGIQPTPELPSVQAAQAITLAQANAKSKAQQSVPPGNLALYEPAQWNMHALNLRLLPTALQVLRDSQLLTIIDNLAQPDGTKNPVFSDTQLHQTVMELLTGSSDFLSALTALTQPFLFQMNATWDDKMWLEHLQCMEVPQSMLVVPLESLTFNLAAQFEIPLLQVICRGPGNGMYATTAGTTQSMPCPAPIYPVVSAPSMADMPNKAENQSNNYNQSGRLMFRYPQTVASRLDGSPVPGRYLYIDAPSWIGPDFMQLKLDALRAKAPEVDALTGSVTNLTADRMARVGQSEARMGFMKYIAEYTFKDQFLGRASARCQIPLFLRPQVGRTYFVKAAGSDETLMIAHLQSVTHTIRIENDGATASTNLTFSHVQARYANLVPVGLAYQTEGLSTPDMQYATSYREGVLNEMQARGVTYQQYSAPDLAAAQLATERMATISGGPLGPMLVDQLMTSSVKNATTVSPLSGATLSLPSTAPQLGLSTVTLAPNPTVSTLSTLQVQGPQLPWATDYTSPTQATNMFGPDVTSLANAHVSG
jgi:hypothetical protein